MTGRNVRRATRAVIAIITMLALVAAPSVAATGPRDPSFGDDGFPSWSRLVHDDQAETWHGASPAAEAARRLAGRRTDEAPRSTATRVSAPANADGAKSRTKARPSHRDAIRWSQGHADGRRMALALTAMGFSYGSTVNRRDIIAAGHRLGVKFGPRIDSGELEKVRIRAWRYGGLRMAASGVDFVGRLDPHDIVHAAERLGIGIGSQVDPGDIEAVIAAGQNRLSKQLRAGGFDHGRVVNTSDLKQAARIYGIRLGKSLRPVDARRIARTVAKGADRERTLLFARIGRVAFHLPGRHPAYVGFHQASSRRALPMRRWGKPLSAFLGSRGRSTHRAGAVDIPMQPGDAVYAPVTGRVVETRTYSLYGRYTDQRLRIVPEDDRRMLTTVLHVKGLKVRRGDRVVAGKTVIASSARKFPFWSQVDGYSGRPWGHVHIETRWR